MNLFSKISSLLLFLFVVWANAQKSDSYTIIYSAEQPERIAVEATLTLEDSLLYMSPYGPAPSRFPAYVHQIRATDKTGKVLNLQFRDSLHWVVEGVTPGEQLDLSYVLQLDHEKAEWPGGIDGVAYKRDYGIMTSGRALFVMNGKDKKDISVRVQLPEGWKSSVPWNELHEQAGVYGVPNLDTLQESFLFSGTHEEIVVRREGFTLKFVLGGEHLYLQKSRITDMGNSLMDYYIDLMGGVPKPAPGQELDQTMVIITENEKTDGEVIGNHISMFMNPNGDPQEQLVGWFIFAHEFYHLWNGKSIKFAGSRSDWFKEGFSNYYTMKGLRKTGFINDEVFTAILNNLFYQRYINDPGLGEKSPVESAAGFSKDRHWGLIYGGGLFTSIAVDMEIRNHSNNQRSLDDLMKELYKLNGGSDQYLNNEDLISKIRSYGYEDFPEFYKRYLTGPEVISLAPYMQHAGVMVSEDNGQLTLEQQPEKSELETLIWEGFLGEN